MLKTIELRVMCSQIQDKKSIKKSTTTYFEFIYLVFNEHAKNFLLHSFIIQFKR